MDLMRLMSAVALVTIFATAYIGGKEERMGIKIPYLIASFGIAVVVAKYFAVHYVATTNYVTYLLAHVAVILLFVIGFAVGNAMREER